MIVTLTIDRQIVHVKRHTPILAVARQLGISIPTLCYHEAVKAYGSCRLCVVEVFRNGRSKLVTSCNYPAEEGLVVFTATEKVKSTRKMVMELLLARCPDVAQVQQLAAKMGIKVSGFKKKEAHRCILCGLCVRACEQIVGVNAISFASRGIEREVSTPFGMDSDACIGCGSCTYICPTGCIEMVGDPGPPGSRTMSMGNLNLDACPQNHDCENCETDHEFLEGMQQALKRVRTSSTA